MNVNLDGLTFTNQYQYGSQGQKAARNLDPQTKPLATAKIKNFSKQLITTNGQVITFSFDDKSISASLLNEEGKYIRIKSESLPIELRKFNSSSAVNKFLEEISVRVQKLSTGNFKVYLSGRLLGGNPIKEVVNELKTYLKSLANPLVNKDILQKFDEFTQNVIDPENLTEGFFLGLIISDSTKEYLFNFFNQIKEIFMKCEDVTKTVNELKTELKNLASEPGVSTLSEALKIFLSLDKIKLLNDKEIIPILQIIKAKGDSEQLEIMVGKIFEENLLDREEIDDCIAKVAPDYEDLTTVLKQIVKQNEVKKDGIGVCWDNTEAFFLDKTLYLTDPGTSKSFHGVIKEATRRDVGWYFQLQNGSTVDIFLAGETYQVRIKEMLKYRFLGAFHHSLSVGDKFKVEGSQELLSSLPIKAGSYQLINVKYQPATIFQRAYNLFNISAENLIYRLKVQYYTDGRIALISIDQWQMTKWEEIPILDESWWYKDCVLKANPAEFKPIPQSKVNSLIRIKDEKDENTIKLTYQKEIQRKIFNIREELLSAENKEFLDQMLDNLVENHLSKVNIEIAKSRNPAFLNRLEGIVRDYEEKLKGRIQLENLFRQLVEEANYARLTDKEKGLSVQKTMELLKGATEHLDKLKNQPLIFLMGNTGSGKSTAANYLIGIPLKSTTNHVGDIVVEAKMKEGLDEEGQPLIYPKIGQSLGESETLYTIGYKIRKVLNLAPNLPLIADCPGFEDTRGGDYVLCTNLCIDQAFNQASCARAIVWTIPIQKFTDDRGNQILDLIDSFIDRFPHTFDSRHSQLSSNVYILITKAEQVSKGTKEAIANGKRFKELFNEADAKITELLQKEELGEFNDLESAKRRRAIWKFLRYMHDNHQIDLIDIGDNIARKELVKKYCSEKVAITKNRFISSMKNRELRSKFGKNIEMSTYTWMLIFEKYLKTLPESIATSLKEIKNKEEQIKTLRKEKEKRLEQAETLVRYGKKLSELIVGLEKAKNNPAAMSNLAQELQEKVKNATNERLNELNQQLIDQDLQNKQTLEGMESLRSQLETLKEDDKNFGNEISSLKTEKAGLEQGTQSVLLAKVAYEANKILKLRYYKAGARENVFQEIRDERDDDFEKVGIEKNTSEYVGTMVHTIRIEKKFKIVPTEKEKRKEFEALGHSGEHEARLEGVGFELDLGRKTAEHGQSIIYGLRTKWDGQVLPWFTITHIIPNSEYNEAAITNLKKKITERESQKVENLERLVSKEKDLLSAQHFLAQLKVQKIEAEQKIKQLSEDLAQNELGKIFEEKKAELQRAEAEAKVLRNIMEIEAKINASEKEIEDEKQKLSATRKTKRNFAIIVKHQIGVVELLRDLSTIVVQQNYLSRDFFEDEEEKSVPSISLAGASTHIPNNSSFASLGNLSNTFTNEASAIITCKKFISTYDQQIDELKQKCQEDLNF